MQTRVAEKEGATTTWSATTSNGETHRYIINGVKDFDRISDDAETFFVWLWSLKDYLKAYSRSKGQSERWVETEASADPCLSVCADIANCSKHGDLSKGSRSGKYPRLGTLKYSFPQQAMGQLTVRAFEVEIDISDPTLVTFEMPILDKDDRVIGDAFSFLSRGVQRWEELLAEIERAA